MALYTYVWVEDEAQKLLPVSGAVFGGRPCRCTDCAETGGEMKDICPANKYRFENYGE